MLVKEQHLLLNFLFKRRLIVTRALGQLFRNRWEDVKAIEKWELEQTSPSQKIRELVDAFCLAQKLKLVPLNDIENNELKMFENDGLG